VGNIRLYLRYISLHLRSQLQYRTSFYLLFLGQLGVTVTTFAGIYFLFQRFSGVGGFTYQQVLTCFGITYMAFSLSECFFRGFDAFAGVLGDGSFDRALVRPRGLVLQVLGARLEGLDDWFYSVHMGWWDDPEEPFQAQWQQLNHTLRQKRAAGPVWLLGDFNSPAEMRGEGYDLMRKDGWLDTFLLAGKKDSGITVSGRIAGWTHRNLPAEGARVDHILCHFPCRVLSSKVIFNGEREAVVSDHFGVMVEFEER